MHLAVEGGIACTASTIRIVPMAMIVPSGSLGFESSGADRALLLLIRMLVSSEIEAAAIAIAGR